MKIDDLLKSQIIQGNPEVDKKKAEGRDDAFATLLQNEMASVQGTAPQTDISALDAGLQISALQGVPGDSDFTNSIESMQDVISKLQSLETGLQENLSPKEIDGIVGEISDASARLKDNMRSLPDNTELSDMAEEINIAAYMESVKWRRGDYL